MTRAGIVTVVGKPNAGKSTLLNRIIGQKLSIVSPKPQSTRDRIVGIHSDQDTQMVILDTPGLLDPGYPLQQAMRGAALAAIADADVILYLVNAADLESRGSGSAEPVAPLRELARLDQDPRAATQLVLNKADLLTAESRAALGARYPSAVFASALTGEGVPALLAAVRERLPESPFLYPGDDVSTQTVRFFTSELVRETALEQLEDEVPYSIACEIEEFRETTAPVYIRAVLHVERESQKRILIGAGGQRIRSIGRVARQKIEELIGEKVYLDLWIKVLPNWRRKPAALQRFGYTVPPA
jgi:GTP-binding protein Era